MNVYFCLAGVFTYALVVVLIMHLAYNHAPYMDEDGHYVDENGKRLK